VRSFVSIEFQKQTHCKHDTACSIGLYRWDTVTWQCIADFLQIKVRSSLKQNYSRRSLLMLISKPATYRVAIVTSVTSLAHLFNMPTLYPATINISSKSGIDYLVAKFSHSLKFAVVALSLAISNSIFPRTFNTVERCLKTHLFIVLPYHKVGRI